MARKAGRAFELGSDLVEFRIDHLVNPDADGILRGLSRYSGRCILTVRSKGQGGAFRGSDEERIRLLADICTMKPAFADVELETAREFEDAVQAVKKKVGEQIVSWHDFRKTPNRSELMKRCDEAMRFGGTTKIVTFANRTEDSIRVLSLYRGSGRKLIAFCMGEKGMFSRILSLYAGSPIVYAALPGDPVAPGQLSIVEMTELTRIIG
jgi:3-dehydroquinate dehydratase-1